MVRVRSTPGFAVFVVLLALAPAALAGPFVPPQSDEASLNARRAEWIEQIHRAAPGDDWRRIERANRLETALRLTGTTRTTGAPTAWTERGAANLTGRNWDGAWTSSGEFLVGSANGGLFRGVPGGSTWQAMTDDLGYAVEHVIVSPGAPDRILIANGSGLHVSLDGGATWSVPAGLPDYVWATARVVQEADAPSTVYALVEGWIWLGTSWDHNWHLLRSTNGGASFTLVHTEPLGTRPDLWISRTGAGPLYMAVGATLRRSHDHGVTWVTAGSLPVSGTSARLAGSEAGAPNFWFATQVGGTWTLFRSTNAGGTWSNVATLTDFYGTLVASITQPLQVLYGGIDCHRSFDGGTTWSLVNAWYEYYGDPAGKLHADIFGLRALLEAPPTTGAGNRTVVRGPNGLPVVETIYVHTDGGTYTLDPLSPTPSNVTQFGFRNAQYYGTLTPLGDPNVFFAGSQDQGYQISHPGLGTVTPDLTQVISGDYAHLVSSWPDRSRMVWSVYPGFVLVQTGPGDSPDLETSDFPAGAPGFRFLPATAPDPTNVNRAYVGARQLWRITRNAPSSYSWTALPHDFDQGTGDVVGAIAWAPSDPSRGIVATYQGRFWRTSNGGATWTAAVTSGPPSHYFAGSSVVISPTDPNVAWAGGSGYSNPPVWKTTDGGATWTPMSTGLPSTQVYALALESPGSPVLYAATQAGPYRWNGATWENLLLTTCCAPLTDWWHVEALPNRGLVRFSTYGRGVWDYATGAVLDAAPRQTDEALALSLSPNPASDRSRVRFRTGAAGVTTVDVFDVWGRRVRTLTDGWRPAGEHAIAFDHRAANGRALESGVYLVRVRTVSGTTVGRLAITR